MDDWEREAQVTAILDQQTLIDNLLATATTAISEAEDPSPFLAEARQVAVTGAFYSASWVHTFTVRRSTGIAQLRVGIALPLH